MTSKEHAIKEYQEIISQVDSPGLNDSRALGRILGLILTELIRIRLIIENSQND